MYSVPPTLRWEPATTSEARYLAGLAALNVVAAEFQLWREFERVWADRPDRPLFAADFGGNAIILAAVAVSFLIAGIFAVRRVYGIASDSEWERSGWSAFVQSLGLTVLAAPVALGVVPLLTALMSPSIGIGIFMIALAKFGLPFALATATWNLAFVVVVRPRP